MSNEYDPFKDRLDENIYKEELEPIRMKFIQYLLDNQIDPAKLTITQPVVEGVIKLMGADNPDWKEFSFPITEKDWTKMGMEHLKDHLRNQMKRNCKPLKAAIL